jgi:hypothetical protein
LHGVRRQQDEHQVREAELSYLALAEQAQREEEGEVDDDRVK